MPDSDAERPAFIGQALSVCRQKVLSLPIASLLFGRHVRPGAVTGQNAASDGSVPQASLNMGPILGRMRKPSFRFFPVVPISSGSSADRLFGAKGKRPAIGVSFRSFRSISLYPTGRRESFRGGYVGCLQKTGVAMVMPNEKADTSFRGIRFLEIVSDFSGPGRIVIRRNRRFRSRRDRTILPFAAESRLSTS